MKRNINLHKTKNQILPFQAEVKKTYQSGSTIQKNDIDEVESAHVLSDAFKASVKEYILSCLEETKSDKKVEIVFQKVVHMSQLVQDPEEESKVKERKKREINIRVGELHPQRSDSLEGNQTPLTGYSSVRELKDSRRSISIVKKNPILTKCAVHRRSQLELLRRRNQSDPESGRLQNSSRPSKFMALKESKTTKQK